MQKQTRIKHLLSFLVSHILEATLILFLLCVALWSVVGQGVITEIIWPKEEWRWEGMITRVGKQEDGTQNVWVEMIDEYLVEVEFPRWPRLLVGERIQWACRMRPFSDEEPVWLAWRARHGLLGRCQSYESPMRSSPPARFAFALARLRLALAQRVRQALPEPHASLVTGMLFGEVGTMPTPVKTTMRQAGLTHLVAVSGGNVAWVLAGVGAMWYALGGGWRLAPFISLFAVGFFVLLSGGNLQLYVQPAW